MWKSAPFVFITIGIICGYIAFLIGRWRYSCRYFEMNYPLNVPVAWQGLFVQIGSWFIVTIFSLIFAYCFATLIVVYVNSLLGKVSFGVFLMIRWIASGISAITKSKREIAEYQKNFGSVVNYTERKF